MKIKKIISVLFMLVVTVYAWQWAFSTDSKEQIIYLVDDDVEKIAEAKGISVIRLEYQTNHAYRGVGEKMRSAENPENFFVLMESLCGSNASITVSVKGYGDYVYKEYWADPCPGVVSLEYQYYGGGYDFKELQEDNKKIIFVKPMPIENYLIAILATLFLIAAISGEEKN